MSLTTVVRTLPCGSNAPQLAREWARHQLSTRVSDAPVSPPLVEDALLCLSELVTNAVEASCEQLTVELALDESRLRVTVVDDGMGWPALQNPQITDTTGRGLVIVDALARRWGVEPSGSTKRVWAELRPMDA
jgi:anti-sigma regulatory factor (Ser/Thr protein kinase)